MNGLCPRCGRVLPILGTQGKEGSTYYAIRRYCDRCHVTVTEETTYDVDEPIRPAPSNTSSEGQS